MRSGRLARLRFWCVGCRWSVECAYGMEDKMYFFRDFVRFEQINLHRYSV